MWKIRNENKYFTYPLIVPFLAILSIVLSQIMFYLLLRTQVFDSESYSRIYPLTVRWSLGNSGFIFICPPIAIISVAFLVFKKMFSV